MRTLSLLLAAFLPLSLASGQEPSPPAKPRRPLPKEPIPLTDAPVQTREVTYKTTPQGELNLHFYLPPHWDPKKDQRPAMVFFFGGGWRSGSYRQFISQAAYFASRGLVCASADYRVSSIHKTTPDACVADAKSAVRWLRQHAADFGIDPQRIIAAGGSAGGHLAAATALVPGFDEPGEDTAISCVPNAMVLFNPALDLTLVVDREILGADGGNIAPAISPTRFLTSKAPPAILFFGTADTLAPHGTGYLRRAVEVGADAELWTAADEAHGFFNHQPWLEATTRKADEFLTRLGYLDGLPTLPETTVHLDRAP
ncbi:MAG: alpha/beta hydrolase [Verrucomicrobiales bacterium]|nr:alpha/beta hydrolase [Verrucomicrobiales bacterium]